MTKKTFFAAVLAVTQLLCPFSALAAAPRSYRAADERRVGEQTPFYIHTVREIQRRREIERLHDLGAAAGSEDRRVGDPAPVGIDADLRAAA